MYNTKLMYKRGRIHLKDNHLLNLSCLIYLAIFDNVEKVKYKLYLIERILKTERIV